jgi:LysR family transcriptional regulator for metE and metH
MPVTSLHDLTLRQLRAVAAVARSRSVTGAAEQLHLTQPAVTLQLKNLQERCGLPLFQRTAKGMIATEAGEMLLLFGERIETALADCSAALDKLKGLSGGCVSIGVVSTAKYFAPFAISAFSKTHPGIDVRLLVGNRGEIIQALADFSLDVAIIGRPPPELQLERVLIGDHPHVIIAPPDHGLASMPTLAVAAMSDETFLIREPGSGTRALMERMFDEAGVKPRIGMEIASNETIKQAVMAGLGIAFLSAHTVAQELADGRLISLPVEGLPLIRHWYVARLTDKTLLPAAEALVHFLSNEAVRFLPALSNRFRNSK